jgi:hypothetical protein
MTTVASTAVPNSSAQVTKKSFWLQLLDWVLESRRRKADAVIVEHLRHHRPDSEFRVELERRLLGR